jgi:hypothetical protein
MKPFISHMNHQVPHQLTWKLSKARAGMLSSNSSIMSQGPSPTPTNTMDKGNSLHTKTKEAISREYMTQDTWLIILNIVK